MASAEGVSITADALTGDQDGHAFVGMVVRHRPRAADRPGGCWRVGGPPMTASRATEIERDTTRTDAREDAFAASLDHLIDCCEATWLAAIDVPPDLYPEELSWCLFKFGQVVDRLRPGLLDRIPPEPVPVRRNPEPEPVFVNGTLL